MNESDREFTLDGKVILVTGGTGSFGRSFVKMIVSRYNPARVIIFSRDELKQYEMAQEINGPNIRYFIGDVRDESRLQRAMKGVQLVIHAAALKQVPAAEYNPIECIKTNILGGENIVNACIDNGVERLLALSTDKAAGPINLYGATKLCSDKLMISANHLSGLGGTKFSVVRYGNVIGSRGSVIPFFKEQAKTGTLPITDPEMTRFWIPLEDGVEFVCRSLFMMKGGEIFIPRLPSMRITDLAKAIDETCKLKVVGIRPGEKLHEVMVPADESINTLEFRDFYVIQPAFHDWDYEDTTEYNGEVGKRVERGFQYDSLSNDRWISVEQLRDLIAST